MARGSLGAKEQLKYAAACCPLNAVRLSLKTEGQTETYLPPYRANRCTPFRMNAPFSGCDNTRRDGNRIGTEGSVV